MIRYVPHLSYAWVGGLHISNNTQVSHSLLGETFVPPTGPCSGRKKWICITAPVCAIPLLVLIICLMKELLCLFRRLTYRLDQREKQVLGSRTSQDARRYRIDDMAMHNNAFNRV